MSSIEKSSICIVGGGSRYTPDMLAMLASQKDRFPLKKIVLYDIEEERQKYVGGYGEVLMKEYYPELEEFIYTTDPEVAFRNIDFALMQIRAGRLKMRESDEKISLKYGCVGQETCGAGGFAYGMRSIPAVVELIQKIRIYSPNAWILNYSNPAAIVAEATKRIFPNDYRIVNICDMPINIMDKYAKLLGISRYDFEPRYFGLNHFGWFTHLYDKKSGKDLLPKVRDILTTRNIYEGKTTKDASWVETYNFLSTMVSDYPEYLPNTYLKYYLYPNHVVETSNKTYTRANEVMDGKEKNIHLACREVCKLKKIKGTKYELDSTRGVHATYIVDLATSIANNSNDIFLVMTENKGTIMNVDPGMMVEVPCRAGINGMEPLAVGEIPTFYKGLLENQYAYEKLTVDAWQEHSYIKALQALVLNRTVVDTDTAKHILNEMIEANKEFWPELK